VSLSASLPNPNAIYNLPLVSEIIRKEKNIFLVRYCAFDNVVCKVFTSNAEREIKALRLD